MAFEAGVLISAIACELTYNAVKLASRSRITVFMVMLENVTGH